MSFAQNLKDMMFLRTMTITELSRNSGVSRNAIYEALRGNNEQPKLNFVKKLSHELLCTPGWLLRK